MEEDKIPVYEIVDPIATRYGHTLHGCALPDNRIAVAGFKPVTRNTRDVPSEYADKDPVIISFLKEEFIFEKYALRGLLAEANGTFVALQMIGNRGQKMEYTKISRTYRSILRASLAKLSDKEAKEAFLVNEITSPGDNNEEEDSTNLSILYAIECVWHLFEILVINPTSTTIVVPQFLEWIRFHYPSSERNATELMLLGSEACKSENYWPTLRILIIQGQINITRALLQIHSLSQTPPFKLVDLILKTLPIYEEGAAIQTFRAKWDFWKVENERHLSVNILLDEPELENLIALVTGNTDVWYQELAKSNQWYEYLPGFLFYTNPVCKFYELSTIATDFLNRWSTEHRSCEIRTVDLIVLQLMQNNLKRVINGVQNFADQQWFAVHLIDLLYHSGLLKIIAGTDFDEYEELRHKLVYDYGTRLFARKSLWQLGVDYLHFCKPLGEQTIRLLLPRLNIKTEKQAWKILNIAKKLQMESVACEICKILGKSSFADERYGNALDWAIRSRDTIFVTAIADFILKHIAKTGKILCPDVIANIGNKMFVSPRLVFLVKYFDFYQYYRKRDFLPASELLINLLESKITPEYFWPSLLVDAVPLLECKDPKILSRETCIILQHIETDLLPFLERKKASTTVSPDDYRVGNIEDILHLLRLACARNLSRSLIIENTFSPNT